MLWMLRAKEEYQTAPRTWFGTLTARPQAHATMLAQARVRLLAKGVKFDELSFGDQFAERWHEMSIEVTKYLKRVRKDAEPFKFRFLCVAEHHKTGLPHAHLLVHEIVEGSVKHESLAKQWELGFEKWRTVSDLNQATYVCKYLTKTAAARVRASAGYGFKGVWGNVSPNLKLSERAGARIVSETNV